MKTHMNSFATAFLIASALLIASAVAASDAAVAKEGDKREEVRARVQEKVRMYLSVELATRAGLDDVKSKKLADVIGAHMQKKMVQRKKMRDETQKLRALVDQKAPDAQIKPQLQAVLAAKHSMVDVDDALEETAKFLTPTEQAKVALALPEAMKGMKGMMRGGADEDDDGGQGGGRRRMRDRIGGGF